MNFRLLLTFFSRVEGGWGGGGLLPTVLALSVYDSRPLKKELWNICSMGSSSWLGGPGTCNLQLCIL